MLSTSPKSSLEEMLESLRQRDEALEKSKELPPALPARPNSRGRLPSARHSLPTNFLIDANGKVESNEENGVTKGKEEVKRKEKELGYKMNSFGSKKIKKDIDSVDSNPYVEDNNEQPNIPALGSMKTASVPEWDDNIGYFTKKKLRIWCRLHNGQWGSGKIESTSGDTANVLVSSGKVVQVSTEVLLPANPDILEGVDDLIQLRPLLIAINPFKHVPIYGPEIVASYQHKALNSPHGKLIEIHFSTFGKICDRLNLKMASDYSYLNQSDCLEIDGVDDRLRFSKLMEALNVIQISKDDQEEAFTMLAAVLWLGNISFDAIDRRDALSKFIYASLFEWLVEQINESLAVGEVSDRRSISILDIYGFESFQRLQQHFNRHLLKLEQEVYEEDGIDWTKVYFEDNQECLNLFEKKPLGLLSLLDEESNFPKATDLTLANKLKQHLNSYPCFKGEKGSAFCVSHYAGEVVYDTNGFLEKNRDPLHSDFTQLLSSSGRQLAQLFASKVLNKSPKLATTLSGLDFSMQSVATKFKGQLFKLMYQLENTTPHFVRCIKPNTKLLPGAFELDLVSQQLRCCGVLEVVRISRSGYPTRMTHQEFARSMSVAVLKQFNVLPEMYQIGYTKIYLRIGQIGILEEQRNQVLRGIVGVQKCFRGCQALIRGWLARKQFDEKRKVKQSIPESTSSKRKTSKKISEVKVIPQEQVDIQASILAELQKRVDKAEATIGQKEEENAALREQLKQFESRWLDYEGKMKTMEEMWQVQMQSLQASLAAARKSLASDNPGGQSEKLDSSTSPRFYDAEDNMSPGSQTPGGSTPKMFFHAFPDFMAGRESNGPINAVGNLTKEFENRTQNFEDDAKLLVEVKAGQSASNGNPEEELRKLKIRFETWKKDFKLRLRETKGRLNKLWNGEADKNRRRWWGKLSTRG
ncbi:hypothetical protein Tsubulata_006796 [Turnera subulata]|uniref:Myosin motor domain-containing protein n=1 Tax=Turnera subulata TaxID=218843 RepID=A0A9Q0G4J9_9ROSI|nr:hypothetical protein Tsubulata_006796 [Turnera subulata]